MKYAVCQIADNAKDKIFCESFTEAIRILLSIFDEWTSKYGDDAILTRDAFICKYDDGKHEYIVNYVPAKELYIEQIPNRRKAGYIK